jgi:hypothetical protein
VGSGLILLVIVAAWLAVLVPMALRSHDSSTSSSSVDRFSDAMRVLSRRDGRAAGRGRLAGLDDDDEDDGNLLQARDDPYGDVHDAVHDDPYGDPDDGEPSRGAQVWARVAPAVGGARERLQAGSPAARRRRLLVGLVALAVLTLVAGLAGPGVLLVVHALFDVALVLFVVQLRRLQVRRAAQARRTAPVRQPASRTVHRTAPSSSVRITPVPRPVAAPAQQLFDQVAVAAGGPQVFDQDAIAPVAAPAAEVVAQAGGHVDEHLDEHLHRAAQSTIGLGAPWSPVPVPPPVYVGAPMAPSRRAAEPAPTGPSTDAAQYEHLLGTVDEAPARDDLVGRRRAANDW